MNRLHAALTLVLLVVPLTASQQTAQPPTFRSAADVVEVDVVVQDRNGRFVADLKPEDFDVREEDSSQKIELFSLVRDNKIATTARAGDPGSIARETDVGAARASTPRIFIAFFDDEHLTTSGFKRVQAAAFTLFEKHFRDGDVGGVVANGQMAGNRLTTVREELLKAIRDAKPNSKVSSKRFDEQTWPRLSEVEAIRIVVNNDRAVLGQAIERACMDDVTLCQNAELAVRGKAVQLTTDLRATTGQTLQRLRAVLNGTARLDGRKTILLLSEGFVADESWPLVQDAVGLAARANARLYTLDARGMDRSGMGDRLRGSDPGTSDSQARLLQQFDPAADSVNSLAIDTGGFVVRNQNYFDDAIVQGVADASTYYVLGYRPEKPLDGKFRRLSVKVNRPGVVVRARRGYLATPRPVSTSPASTTAADPAGASAASPRSVNDAEAAGNVHPEVVAGRSEVNAGAATPTVVTRTRPDANKHVETLAPTGRDSDADASAGWSAYQRGDLESARASLAKAASRAAARPWVHYALGQSQYALRQYQDAAGSWETVRSTTPEFRPVYFDLVDAYLQLKDYDKATRVLRDGEKRWRRDNELLNALGVVQVTRGALDDAVQSFEEAVKAAPTDAVGYFNLGKACELRYWKFRRYVSQTRQWVANGNDRNKAIDNYKRYLDLGGPLENAARDGLTRLDWNAPR